MHLTSPWATHRLPLRWLHRADWVSSLKQSFKELGPGSCSANTELWILGVHGFNSVESSKPSVTEKPALFSPAVRRGPWARPPGQPRNEPPAPASAALSPAWSLPQHRSRGKMGEIWCSQTKPGVSKFSSLRRVQEVGDPGEKASRSEPATGVSVFEHCHVPLFLAPFPVCLSRCSQSTFPASPGPSGLLLTPKGPSLPSPSSSSVSLPHRLLVSC